jgi:hypothetical protein
VRRGSPERGGKVQDAQGCERGGPKSLTDRLSQKSLLQFSKVVIIVRVRNNVFQLTLRRTRIRRLVQFSKGVGKSEPCTCYIITHTIFFTELFFFQFFLLLFLNFWLI